MNARQPRSKFPWRVGQFARVNDDAPTFAKKHQGKVGEVKATSPKHRTLTLKFSDGHQYSMSVDCVTKLPLRKLPTRATDILSASPHAESNFAAFYACDSCDQKWNVVVPNEDTPRACPNCHRRCEPESAEPTDDPLPTRRDSAGQAVGGVARTYEALHDGLSDMIEDGRLSEADIPDDYRWLVESLVLLAKKWPGHKLVWVSATPDGHWPNTAEG